jgi:hypothetical protein
MRKRRIQRSDADDGAIFVPGTVSGEYRSPSLSECLSTNCLSLLTANGNAEPDFPYACNQHPCVSDLQPGISKWALERSLKTHFATTHREYRAMTDSRFNANQIFSK